MRHYPLSIHEAGQITGIQDSFTNSYFYNLENNTYIPKTAYLKSIIRSIWQIDLHPGFRTETILPKGNAEVIFNFGKEYHIHAAIDGKEFQPGKCFINGFNTSPIRLLLPQHHILFGIQFHPAAIRKLFGAPASEFSNAAIDLSLINPSFYALWEQMAHKTFNERVAMICNWIERKYIEFQPREQYLHSFLVNNLQQTVSVTELSREICYSSRQLSRKLYELTSLNAEDVILYKKYLRSVGLIQQTDMPLTEIAYESHFSDQSHFIKSFRTFAHITPGEYRRQKSFVPGHLFTDVR